LDSYNSHPHKRIHYWPHTNPLPPIHTGIMATSNGTVSNVLNKSEEEQTSSSLDHAKKSLVFEHAGRIHRALAVEELSKARKDWHEAKGEERTRFRAAMEKISKPLEDIVNKSKGEGCSVAWVKSGLSDYKFIDDLGLIEVFRDNSKAGANIPDLMKTLKENQLLVKYAQQKILSLNHKALNVIGLMETFPAPDRSAPLLSKVQTRVERIEWVKSELKITGEEFYLKTPEKVSKKVLKTSPEKVLPVRIRTQPDRLKPGVVLSTKRRNNSGGYTYIKTKKKQKTDNITWPLKVIALDDEVTEDDLAEDEGEGDEVESDTDLVYEDEPETPAIQVLHKNAVKGQRMQILDTNKLPSRNHSKQLEQCENIFLGMMQTELGKRELNDFLNRLFPHNSRFLPSSTTEVDKTSTENNDTKTDSPTNSTLSTTSVNPTNAPASKTSTPSDANTTATTPTLSSSNESSFTTTSKLPTTNNSPCKSPSPLPKTPSPQQGDWCVASSGRISQQLHALSPRRPIPSKGMCVCPVVTRGWEV
jgi:hypothetical protein